MYIEYASINKLNKKNSLLEDIRFVHTCGIRRFVIWPYYAQNVIDCLGGNLNIYCPIDYPLGVLDTATRVRLIQEVSKYPISGVDVVVQQYYLYNKPTACRKDLEYIHAAATNCGLTLRVMVDAVKNVDKTLFYSLMKMVKDAQIGYLLLATGFFAEDLIDNIILCEGVTQKYKIKTIINGNIYLPNHVSMIPNNIYGFRLNNINAVASLFSAGILPPVNNGV